MTADKALALEFGSALCSEFAAMLESEHRYDMLEARYAAQACLDQAEAIFAWPEEDEDVI